MHRLNHLIVVGITAAICSLCMGADTSEAPKADAPKRAEKLPAIKTAGIDAHGRLLVNGEPFFPILMYVDKTDEATMKSLTDAGFNVVTTHGEHAAELLDKGFYAAVHGGGKSPQLEGIVLGIGVDSPALSYPTKTIEQTHAANDAVRKQLPGRPIMNAIGYWENEPEGVAQGKLPRKEKYEDIVAAIEVPAPYLYPVPYQSVDTVADALNRARRVSGGKQMLLPILQTFAWTEKDRYPRPDELRCMVYLSLIEGSNGIGYYAYHTITGKKNTDITREQPDLWAAVGGVNGEARAIGTFALAANEMAITAEGGPSDGKQRVRIRAITKGKEILFLIANPTDKAVTVPLQSPKKLASLTTFTGPAVSVIFTASGKAAKVELGAMKTAALIGKVE